MYTMSGTLPIQVQVIEDLATNIARAGFANGARDSDGQTALMHASQYRAGPAAACDMIQKDRPFHLRLEITATR